MRRLSALLLAAALLLLAAAPTTAAAGAWTRPVSDWLDAQQVLDTSIAVELSEVSFYEPSSGEQYIADMDGRIAAWVTANGGALYEPDLSGSVHERLLPDGRSLVTVRVRFSSAITYIWLDENDFADFPNGPELFGHRASEIADGAPATLGQGMFSITFTNPVPGGPLPLLEQLAFAPEEGQEIISVTFSASARGPLREASGYPEGTPGMGATQQIGVFQASTPDGYPVEWVTYRPVGS
jgi:hypothetical protein